MALRHAVFAIALPSLAIAEQVEDITWNDLLPDGATPTLFTGVVEHNQAAMSQPTQNAEVRSDLNGKTVRITGFVVPLDYTGTEITAFVLVPFIGACIHVPPPPPNQLILVSTETPFSSGGMYEPVTVTGMIGAAATQTQLADIGYSLSADRIVPFD